MDTENSSPAHETTLFDGACRLRWLGTNCLLIRWAGTALLVDPHFSRPALPALLRKIAPRPDRIRGGLNRLGADIMQAVLITHTHYDHFLDAFETARLTGAVLYGSESVQRAAGPAEAGVIVQTVQPGAVYRIGSLAVTFFPTRHLAFPGRWAEWLHLNDDIDQPLTPPIWFWQYRAGTMYNLLIEHAGRRIYLQGSAGLCHDGASIPAAEAAVLGIGALGFKRRAYLRRWYGQAVEQTGAQQIYLSHWDDFFRVWDGHPHDLPGTRRVIRSIRRLAAGCEVVEIHRLTPG